MPHGFTPRQFQSILSDAPVSWKKIRKGDLIVEVGSDIVELHYLLKGKVAIHKKLASNDSGTELVTETAEPSWLGELWDEKWDETKEHKWIVTVRAMEDTYLASFPKIKLHQWIRKTSETIHAADRAQIQDLWVLWTRIPSCRGPSHSISIASTNPRSSCGTPRGLLDSLSMSTWSVQSFTRPYSF